jgi:hypothetical protein
MNSFRGVRYQRGHGLGSIFSNLFRSAIPLFKRGSKYLGHEMLNTGLEIADDVIKGRSLKNSAKKRVREGGTRVLNKTRRVIRRAMKGGGGRRVSRSRKKRALALKSDQHPVKRLQSVNALGNPQSAGKEGALNQQPYFKNTYI